MFTNSARGNGSIPSLEVALARVLHTKTGVKMIHTSEFGAPICFVISKKFDADEMERIAMSLSEDDVLVSYHDGCNFLRCEASPMPTPATAPKIQRIPANLDEALAIAKSYGLAVTSDVNISGKRTITVVSNDKSALTEGCFELSYRGLHVSHIQNSNFVLVTDVDHTEAKTEVTPTATAVAV